MSCRKYYYGGITLNRLSNFKLSCGEFKMKQYTVKRLKELELKRKTTDRQSFSESSQKAPENHLNHIGNQATSRLLQEGSNKGKADDPHTILSKLGAGKPLEKRTRDQVGKSYGEDFSDVRIHTDANATNLSNQLRARAFTVGKDIVMPSNQYKPGTIAGDALMAHELAHVAQQNSKRGSSASYGSLEKDADRSASSALSWLWLGAKQSMGNIRRNAGPALGAGLRLQKCIRSSLSFGDQQVPDYLGPESRETLETIKNRFESASLLQNTLVYAPLITIFAGAGTGRGAAVDVSAGTASHNFEAQARAVSAVPAILRSRVMDDIHLLLVMHGNRLNNQEKAYWNRILSRFQSPGGLSAE